MSFYGVWKGKVPGIYENWEDCKKQIYGFNGSKFKKLESKTYEEALIEYQKGYIAKNITVRLTDEERKEKKAQKREKNLAKLERLKANKELYKLTREESREMNRLAKVEANRVQLDLQRQQKLIEKEIFEKKYGKPVERVRPGKLPIHQAFEGPQYPPSDIVIPSASLKSGFFTFKFIAYPSGDILFDSKASELKERSGGSKHIADLIALVLALKYLMDKGLPLRVCTDSKTVLSWYTNMKINASEEVLNTLSPGMKTLLDRVLSFLEKHQEDLQEAQVMEWSSKKWGFMPGKVDVY